MYHEHFGLNRSPFSIEPDPDFLWLGEKHREGLSVLQYGILENKGFLLLTGDAGTGKTVLIRRLLTRLTGDVAVAAITDPRLTPLDFFNLLSHELGMDAAIDGKADFLIEFKKFVRRVYGSQKRLLIIIDEAQRLTNELIEEIRVLSSIDYDNRQLVNIFFVGQIEFNQILTAPCNRALRQRIAVSYHLLPFNPDETGTYIRHRLKVAGTEKELFMPEAVHEIFKISNGIPRLINILCDRALITGFIRNLNRVGPEMIRECARELDISSGAAPADIRSAPRVEKPTAISPADIRSAPQIEKPAAIEEKAEPAEAVIEPFRTRRKWIPAAVAGAAAFLLFGIFFIRAPETNRAPAPGPAEQPIVEIHPAIHADPPADPKDSSPAALPRVSDRRPSQTPPDGGSHKSPGEGAEKVEEQTGASGKSMAVALPRLPGPIEKTPHEDPAPTHPPERPAGLDPSAAEKKTASPAEWTSKSLESTERRFLLFFKPNSAELEDSSYKILRQVSDFLSANPHSEVILATHSTRKERRGLNPKLAELRAAGIRSILAAQPNFKGAATVIHPEEPPAGGSAKPRAEIRIRPGAKNQVVD